MRFHKIAVLLTAPIALAGCAELLDSYGYGNNGYGNGTYGNGNTGGYGYNNNSGTQTFERAAVDACGREASRYGQVSIANVQQGRDVVQVFGSVRDNRNGNYNNQYNGRQFRCTFDSRGRITQFQI